MERRNLCQRSWIDHKGIHWHGGHGNDNCMVQTSCYSVDTSIGERATMWQMSCTHSPDKVEYSYKRHQHQTAATAQAPKCQTAPARLVHRLTVQNWSKDLDLLIAQTGYLIYSMYFDIKVVSEDGADELPDGSDDSTGSRIDRFEAFVCARDSVTARDIFTLYRVPRKWVSSGT